MPNIVACYKWVLDEQDIRINPGNLSLDSSRAKYKISDYDRNAIEEAVLIADKYGGSVTALTFGPNAAKQSLKDALSRGPERVYWVSDDAAEKADAYVTANVLTASLKKIGQYDIILCGEGSADSYSQQVGPRIAALLGIPAITFVAELKIEGDKVIAVRKLGNCTETAVASMPVVISVLPEINKPRIPSLKQVLGAAKKPVTAWKLSDLNLSAAEIAPKNSIKAIKGYTMSRKNIIYKDGGVAEQAAALVVNLHKEGVL